MQGLHVIVMIFVYFDITISLLNFLNISAAKMEHLFV